MRSHRCRTIAVAGADDALLRGPRSGASLREWSEDGRLDLRVMLHAGRHL